MVQAGVKAQIFETFQQTKDRTRRASWLDAETSSGSREGRPLLLLHGGPHREKKKADEGTGLSGVPLYYDRLL
jgi:hypothetical protein